MNTDIVEKKKLSRFIGSALTVLVAVLIIIWFISGFSGLSKSNSSNQLAETESAIKKSASLCYSIEGRYPQDIQYLEDNYGLFLNSEKYIVEYETVAENVAPSIKVFPRN